MADNSPSVIGFITTFNNNDNKAGSLFGSLRAVNNDGSPSILGVVNTITGIDPNPPYLTVDTYPTSPVEDAMVTIAGTVRPESTVSINGIEFNTTYNGNGWSATYDLPIIGVNTIVVESNCYGIILTEEITITYAPMEFEVYNSHNVLLTGQYPITFSTAFENEDFSETKAIKIKNLDETRQATFTLTIVDADTLVENVLRFSTESNPTLLQTATTACNPQSFTELINIHATIPKDYNPADGYHYFKTSIHSASIQ